MRLYPNGQAPASALKPVAGEGLLLAEAAAGWNALAAHIYEREGFKIAPNGPFSTFRTYGMQVEMKRIYGSNAATPGYSNHGLAITVDTDDHELVNEYGAPFGFQKSWSDAGWEPWHICYQEGHYDGPDPGPDYAGKPPAWWKTIGKKIKHARKRRLSKKQRRKQTDDPKRKAKLHRQIDKLGDNIKRWIKRRRKAS